MPSVTLYEYFARTLARDITHTIFARLIKAEMLLRLNMFNECIGLLRCLHKADRLPHHIDDKFVINPPQTRYVSNQEKKNIKIK